MTTNANCAGPRRLFTIADNAVLDCSWEKCIVECKDKTHTPTIPELVCNEGKRNYFPVKGHVNRINFLIIDSKYPLTLQTQFLG